MVTSAKITDARIAVAGRRVRRRAAAGGPTSSANISRAPTIGTLMVVAQARIRPKITDIVCGLTPRDGARSGSTDAVSNGR